MFEIKYWFLYFIKIAKMALDFAFFGLLCLISKVEKDKIVFCCHLGRNGINCNPKYIAREIIRQKLPYKLVWMCNKKFMQKDEEFKDIQFVDYENRFEKFKALATSKIWIDNSYKPRDYACGLIKKKNQFYINTWHGSLGIKRIFWDSNQTATQSKFFLKCMAKDFKNCDILLTNSEWEENVFKKAFRYNGVMKRFGHPRNDIFFEDRETIKNKVYKHFNIPLDKKIALYIPSFRTNLNLECYEIDYFLLKDSLSKRFGGDWVCASKFHPVNLSKPEALSKILKADYDFSYYPDTQELLMSAEVIISDYSSCMFDFMLTRRPCFVYATDIDEYEVLRGLYYPLSDTPFPVAQNNQELNENILNFDYEKYKNECEKFLDEKNALEDGNASKRVVEVIKEMMK